MRAEDASGSIAGVHQAWHGCLTAIAGIVPDGQPHPAAGSLYRQLTSRSIRDWRSPGSTRSTRLHA